MAKKKSLQKLTEIEKLNTVEATKEFYKKNPKMRQELWESITKKISKSYGDELGEEDVLINMLIAITDDEEVITDIRNTTYETNHNIITGFIHNYLLDKRYFPSIGSIAQETKLSRQTVYNHLNNGFTDKYNTLVKGKNEIMALQALSKLYLIGIEDRNVTALKHFIQLSGLVKKNQTNINNYIQVNNLKITSEDFNKLPHQDILEIESILSKTLIKNETI